MSIKPLIITAMLIITATLASAQQVQVSQSFVDDATKSFIEVRALRELEDARKAEIAAKDQQIILLQQLIDAQKIGLKVRDDQIADLSKLKANKFSMLFGLIKFTRYK